MEPLVGSKKCLFFPPSFRKKAFPNTYNLNTMMIDDENIDYDIDSQTYKSASRYFPKT